MLFLPATSGSERDYIGKNFRRYFDVHGPDTFLKQALLIDYQTISAHNVFRHPTNTGKSLLFKVEATDARKPVCKLPSPAFGTNV